MNGQPNFRCNRATRHNRILMQPDRFARLAKCCWRERQIRRKSMIDLTKWFVMPSVREGLKLSNDTVYGRETHHLEGTKPDGSAAEREYHVDTGYSLQFI